MLRNWDVYEGTYWVGQVNECRNATEAFDKAFKRWPWFVRGELVVAPVRRAVNVRANRAPARKAA